MDMASRLKKITVFVFILIALLAARLAYIQIGGEKDFSSAVRNQSLISIEGGNTRGIIYDRYGRPLVADSTEYVYIIKKDRMDKTAKELLKKAGASEQGYAQNHVVYTSERYIRSAGRKLAEKYDAYIVETSSRYSEKQTAVHLIGYVNKRDASGAAGLELMLDDRLSPDEGGIYAAADVKGNILGGRGLITAGGKDKNSRLNKGVRTTIDKDIQAGVEKILEEAGHDCGVVITDVSGGGICAMASTPVFDPERVDAHMKNSSSELINKVTQGQYPPGSVFKIVVTAAALEKGIDPGVSYECRGSFETGGVRIACDTGGDNGHGVIGLKEAFAESCNCFFIQLAEDTGASDITRMAECMGFGKKAITDYPHQSVGHVMTAGECFGGGTGNLSIGQGQMLATPLQVARMTGIIASSGKDYGLRILSGENSRETAVVTEETSEIIKELMKETVISGTASSLKMTDEKGMPETAVKTGTAEFGTKESRGTHGWMTGFAPCEEPQYVITVLVEGGKAGSGDAGIIYKKILDYLKDHGYISITDSA